MTSSEDRDLGRSVLVLPSDTFRIIFQLTKEMSGLTESRLAAAGLDVVAARVITKRARTVLPAAKAGRPVRVVVREAASDGDLDDGTSELTPAGDALLVVSAEQLRAWRAGLPEVVEGLAGKELFYRTGYYDNEVAAAIAAMGN
jgi:hypothetical protein